MGRCQAIGLTGGIGSGKSLAASMFANLAVPTLDLDLVGKELSQPGQIGFEKVIHTFGQSILHADGTLNRMALGDICFKNSEKLQQLNQILHPLIQNYESQWLTQQQAPYAIIEASVLIESGSASRMDAVIVIFAPLELRKQRVLQRKGYDAQRFEHIITQQCNDDTRQNAAHYQLNNQGSKQALQQEINALHQRLLQQVNTVKD